jgi:hypothetical protein
MITPNPRYFGVWGVIGKRVEVENPNGVSAKCAILGTISRKTSDSTDKCSGQNLLDIAVTNALELYEVRISKIDPVVTRAPPGMQNMSKNMAKMST